MGILELLQNPWPWYVAGPLIGLTVPTLLLLGNKQFGISSTLRDACAMLPSKNPFFRYNWRQTSSWNLMFTLGILLGAFIAATLLSNPNALTVTPDTTQQLESLGVPVTGAFLPASLFSWQALLTLPGFLLMVGGGFLVGFGARYAGGCTSGHAISGLSNLQLPSLVAVIGFFAGGLVMTHVFLPLILKL